MKWDGPIKSIYIDLPEDLHLAVKSEAPKRRLTAREAYIRGMTEWLFPKTKSEAADLGFSVPEGLEPYVREFARWLAEPARSNKEEELKRVRVLSAPFCWFGWTLALVNTPLFGFGPSQCW